MARDGKEKRRIEMLPLDMIEDNVNALIYAILKNTSVDEAWKEITGEPIGFKPIEYQKDIDSKADLLQAIIELKREGHSLRVIGASLGMSPSTVHYIYSQHLKDLGQYVKRYKTKLTQKDEEEIFNLKKTMSFREIAKIYHVGNGTIVQALKRYKERIKVHG